MTYAVDEVRKKKLFEFAENAGLFFNDISFLHLAFCHRSSSNEDASLKNCNNERLEFLGDSVLGMATSSYLYRNLPDNSEGELAKIKSIVVSEKALAPVAIKFGVDKMLVLGRGEEMSGGRTKPAILADCMEAIIGAYFLDSGYEAAEKFVLSFMAHEVEEAQKNSSFVDFKTNLQEWFQKKNKANPVYKVVDICGPDHDLTFSVTVSLGDEVFGPAIGKSKKEAEQHAAQVALKAINLIN